MGRDMRKLSEIHENRLAKKTGGRKTINSGAFRSDPSDVSLKHYLIDAKTMEKPQYTQTLDIRWFGKVRSEAFSAGKKDGLIAFDFGQAEDFIAGHLNTWLENVEMREHYFKLIQDVHQLCLEFKGKEMTELEVIEHIKQMLEEEL